MPTYDMYARMSVGLDGKEENVENQIADMEKLAERLGVTIGERLVDGLSAWKRGVRRPGWEKLIERMDQGLSDGVLIWHVDRLMRLPRDLETLLSIADDRKLSLASAHGTRDLQDPDDRFILRIEVAHACRSSDDTSRRIKRKLVGRRERGQLIEGGPRPFAWPGYEVRKPGQTKRRPVAPERLKAEQEALQWAFQTIAEGGKLAEVARKWNEQGLLACYGHPWRIETVRQTMKRQRYAGRIEHEGKVVGRIKDHKPLIDPELFDRVMGIFAARKLGRPAGQQSLGSGLIHCSKCKATMVSRPQYRYYRDGSKVTIPSYKCTACGGPLIAQAVVDERLREFTIGRLSDPRVSKAVAARHSKENDRLTQVRAELEAARATEVGLAAKLKAKRISWEVFEMLQEDAYASIERLEAELKELEAAAADLGAVRARSALAVEQEWDRLRATGDVEALRELIQSALPRRLVRVVIMPGVEDGTRIPAEERVRLVRVRGGITNPPLRAGVGA